MKNIRFFILLVFALLITLQSAYAQKGDSPETLEWVLNVGITIENRLMDAITFPDEPNLLIKLMESYEEFEAVALIGLYCLEVRVAAEEGRNQCNWLTNNDQGKDLTSLIIRAQNARIQAFTMKNEAAACLKNLKQYPPDQSFTLADIIRSNAKIIEYDLNDGLASQNFHILSQKIEHAERIFHDTEVLAIRLNTCETVRDAARKGILACKAIIASPNWTSIKTHVQEALTYTAKMEDMAGSCLIR